MTIEAQRTALTSMPIPKPTLAQIIIERIREGASIEETKEYYRFLREIQAEETEREAKSAYDQARSLLEVELTPIATDCANPQTRSKYASLAQVVRAIRPLYSKRGIVVDFDTADSPKGATWQRVLAFVTHTGGYSFQRHIDMPADGKGAQGRDVMTQTHAIGSSVTYGRRYLLLMIFNLAVGGEDDDGNATSNGKSNEDEDKPITREQYETIFALLDKNHDRVQRFSTVQGCALRDMPASRFDGAVAAIKAVNEKIKAKAAGGQS